LKEGDFFGEVSFLTGLPCTASVKAIRPTEVVRLRKEDFDQILVNHSQATQFLLQTVYVRVKTNTSSSELNKTTRERRKWSKRFPQGKGANNQSNLFPPFMC
jgi:CRP-like cAMP-binding protein